MAMIPDRRRMGGLWLMGLLLAPLTVALGGPARAQGPPVRVTVQDEKPVVLEPVAPLDPVKHINYFPQGLWANVQGEQGQTLHLSYFPTVNVDGQLVTQSGRGGRALSMNQPLLRGKGRRNREGVVSIYEFGDIRITATITLTPTKPAKAGGKRRLDAVLTEYLVENRGQKAHKFGFRVYMDVFVVNNDGALFAAPTVPNQILDGRVLKGKEMPPYLALLQQPNLKEPGFVAHLTFDLGSKFEKPDNIVLSRFGLGFNTWEMPVAMAGGDSALAVFWEPREIRPGGKRHIAYAYGQGIATSPENEGRVELALGGSFEPGKLFNISAYVLDPAPGQYLTLRLPEGMVLADGKECQPVPAAQGDEARSLVVWRARVQRTGRFPVQVQSSTGVTQGKLITVAPRGG
jgi:hypothetical protein